MIERVRRGLGVYDFYELASQLCSVDGFTSINPNPVQVQEDGWMDGLGLGRSAEKGEGVLGVQKGREGREEEGKKRE